MENSISICFQLFFPPPSAAPLSIYARSLLVNSSPHRTPNHSSLYTERFMGSGLSSNHRSSVTLRQPPEPALVIAGDGSLREFSPPPSSSPASVSDVLGGNAGRFFVCSSDALYFDADVPALGGDELLRPGQIYFVLPAAMLGRPLSRADMAALAVRASEALAARAGPRGRARGLGVVKVRVVPRVQAASGCGDGDGEVNEKLNQRTLGQFVTASPTPGRVAKKLAARPTIKRVLSTIEEDAE
ncbi:hypothetical protein ACP70R_043376 [Stipagrostis hirtigluma subsp. patula]